jgi:hypothetical protein
MMFKKPKQDVLDEIFMVVDNKINYTLQSNLGSSININTGSVSYAIKQAIAEGIREAFSVMIDNVYTDAEFEEDIGLREKSDATKQ